jgi:hypothetical protein
VRRRSFLILRGGTGRAPCLWALLVSQTSDAVAVKLKPLRIPKGYFF